ncbi:Dabb family protein [Niabella digestorum]|uniref:Dabb family protein n=1 Tax=Niabella digestorum TaxID=3117701 RepID=A0ABU7RIP8_9BACT
MKKNSRRQFIKSAAIAAIAPSVLTVDQPKQILHQVFFWLKNPESEADKQALLKGLRTLKAIPQIKKLIIGTPAATEKRPVIDSSYDICLLEYLSSVEDEKAYQVHPIHKAFVEQCSHLWKKVQIYDVEVME